MIRRALLIAVAICVATSLYAGEGLRVISPADGAVLRGGHFYTLAWDAASLPAHAEEWEAFASVDGGRYYCARLTPHLDIDIRRFDVLIPNVDSDDFRLLIRTGDERRETIIELPQRFRIRADINVDISTSTGTYAPESARPGERPVVVWATGDRTEISPKPPQLFVKQRGSAHEESSASSSRGSADTPALTATTVVTRSYKAPQHSVAARRDILVLSTRMNV